MDRTFLAEDAFNVLLQYSPLVAFGFVLLAPLTTINDIRTRKGVGEYSPFPFISLFANCFLWTIYGYLANAFTCLVANAVGMTAGFIFTCIFAQYGTIPRNHLIFAGGVCFAVIVICITSGDLTKLGILGVFMVIILLSSPLVAVQTVLRDKDSSSMPFKVSLSMFLNGLSWFFYGYWVEEDMYIWVPNAIGSGMSMVQLLLIYQYPPKKRDDMHCSQDPESNIFLTVN